MSRSVKDLRELICVSRLTVHESDDEQEYLSDEEQQIIRAFSRSASYAGDYRPESVVCARPVSVESGSPDSGIGTNGQSPNRGDGGHPLLPAGGALSPCPPPGGARRSGASRRKRKARQMKALDTLPTMHDLPHTKPLPPVTVSPLHRAESSSDEERVLGGGGSWGGGGATRTESPMVLREVLGDVRQTNFDALLTYMDATMVAEWLNFCNEQVAELMQWLHTGNNFVDLAHFWLSDFPQVQRIEIFQLEYSIIIDHLDLVFAAGRDSGVVCHQLLEQFLDAIFWEYPKKMLSPKGPHLFLNYLDTLTSARHESYKRLLSDVRCSTRVKQHAQWTLAARAFTIVNVWLAIVNFYRRLHDESSKAAPVLHSTIDMDDPSMDRIYHAIREGYVDVVHYLLASGKVNARGVDDQGRTLIFTAVMHNQPDIVRFLLTKVTPQPDCNQPACTGNSPLHAAANNGDVALVTTLLRVEDIQMNQCNRQCEDATPLHLAVMHGHQHVVEVLLVAGADRHAKMGDLTASDIARDFGHDAIRTMLQQDQTELLS